MSSVLYLRQPLMLFMFVIMHLLMAEFAAAALPSAARFARLDVQQGLSQATVTALAQDQDDNIWIGTQNGLNRYDGFAVTVFRPDARQSHSLSDNFVTALQVDSSGAIWVGTLNGLNRFDPKQGRFDSIKLTAAKSADRDVVLSLHLDAAQQLWVGTNNGLALWQADQQTVSWLVSGEQLKTVVKNSSISAISAAADGTLWLGTPRGLVHFDPASNRLNLVQDFPVTGGAIMSLHHDSAGRLWVGLEQDGLLMRQPDSARWTQLPISSYTTGISNNEIRSIISTSANEVWVGSERGLLKLQLTEGQWQQQENYQHQRHNPASLGSGKVVSLLQDHDGSIWVGTWNGGVSRLNQANNLFTSITPDLPLMSAVRNPATISLASSPDLIWLGSADGLFQLNTLSGRFKPVTKVLQSTTFYSALALPQQIWFGHSQGIIRLDPATAQYQDLALPEQISPRQVRRMWAGADKLWLAIDQLGIVILDAQSNAILARHPFSRSITFIQAINQRFVLVGSYSGLSWFDINTGELLFEHAIASDSDSDNNYLTLPSAPMAYVSDAFGRHWLASNGSGLLQLQLPAGEWHPDAVHFKQYFEAEGLASGELKAAELDQQGNIWLSTAVGISVFNPQESRFSNYGYRHGTLRRDYINAASTRMADDTIVFGGMDGFTLFKPAQVLAYTPKPIARPSIVALDINGTSRQHNSIEQEAHLAEILHKQRLLTIPAAGSRSFSVSFSSREFIETEQVQFQYRLDPVSSDWVNQDATNRSASFERLPPGRYTLRLRAGLPQLDWSEETQLDIEVLPLWWETWWARLWFFCLLLFVPLGLHFYRLNNLHRQQEQLAWLVKERTEALEESKDKAEQTLQQLESTMKELVRTEKMAALGQLVAGVAHEVNTPLGVALTANSVVTEESALLQQKLASGNIRRQELEDYLKKLVQAGRLLEHNLQRAAQLVANFKQVSVDRTADNQRQFNLALYLDELLESLSLMWRSRQIILRVTCPDDLVMDSYPGTIGQIITNLTQNAIIHGFTGRDSGDISLTCRQLQQQVEIVFADNGIGISSDNLERIFDPFFTTNRHQGGTGLGLHIVYNLITQKLGGSIKVSSTLGVGTRFTLVLPLKLTER